MQSVTSGEEWSVVSGCQKVESLIGSGASSVKSPTDVDIIADILQQCSQFLSTHDEVSIALMTSTLLIFTDDLYPVYTIQPVVTTGLTTDCIHDTAGCQAGCQTGLRTR